MGFSFKFFHSKGGKHYEETAAVNEFKDVQQDLGRRVCRPQGDRNSQGSCNW